MIRHFVGIRFKTEDELVVSDDEEDEVDEEEVASVLPKITALSLARDTGVSLVDESFVSSSEVDVSYVEDVDLCDDEEVAENHVVLYEVEGETYWYSADDFKQGVGFRGYKVFLDAELKEPVGKLVMKDSGHSTFTFDKMSV